MSLIETVAAHIRKAKAADPGARVSDFQIRVDADRTALIDLRTGAVRIIPAPRNDGHFAEFCEGSEPHH